MSTYNARITNLESRLRKLGKEVLSIVNRRTTSSSGIVPEYFYALEDGSLTNNVMNDVPSLLKTLDATSRYQIECELFITENGAFGTQFLLGLDSLPAFGNITYEVVGGVADTLQDLVTGADFGSEDWATIFVPGSVTPNYGGWYILRITGMIATGVLPIALQVKAGNANGLGNAIANVGSFLKTTKIV